MKILNKIQKKHNLINKKFGKLKVISLYPSKNRGRGKSRVWLCLCDCGNKKIVKGNYLKHGTVKSCGCIKYLTKNKSSTWKGYGDISGKFFRQIKASAIIRNIPFKLTIEKIWNLFLEQKKRCALTDIELNFQSRGCVPDGTASLDRIDSSKGYVIGNIQWIHKDVNRMKSDLSNGKFLGYCELIYKQKNKNI